MANGKLAGFVFAKHNVQMFALAECIFKTAAKRRRWCGTGGGRNYYFILIVFRT